MVSRHVSKDSWSRCEQPSMLYSAVRSPGVPNPASIPKEKIKDTIESTQQRLKQERLNKLDSKGLELPHESYVAVVQVGKYMFFAVMLPVYLCCYGVPRWFLANALPQLFEAAKTQAMNLGRFIVEKAKNVTDLMKGMLDQLIGDALRMSKDRAKNLMKRLSRKFRSASERLANVAKAFSRRLNGAKNSASKHTEKIYKKAEGHVLKTNEWIRKRASTAASHVASWLLKYFQMFDRILLTPFMKIVSLPFNFISFLIRTVKAFFAKILKKIKDRFKKMTDPVIALLKKIVKKIAKQAKKIAMALIQPVLKWLKAIKAALMTYFQKIKKAIIDPVTGLIYQVYMGMKRYIAKKFPWAEKQWQIIGTAFKHVSSAVSNQVTKRFSKKKEEQKGLRYRFKQTKQKVVGLFSKCVQFFQLGTKLFRKVQGAIGGFFKFWGAIRKQTSQKLFVFPKKILKTCLTGLKMIAFITARVVFAGQVLVALICMAFISGFQLVKEVVRPYENALFTEDSKKTEV